MKSDQSKKSKLIERHVSLFCQTKPPSKEVIGPNDDGTARKVMANFFDQIKSGVHVAQ